MGGQRTSRRVCCVSASWALAQGWTIASPEVLLAASARPAVLLKGSAIPAVLPMGTAKWAVMLTGSALPEPSGRTNSVDRASQVHIPPRMALVFSLSGCNLACRHWWIVLLSAFLQRRASTEAGTSRICYAGVASCGGVRVGTRHCQAMHPHARMVQFCPILGKSVRAPGGSVRMMLAFGRELAYKCSKEPRISLWSRCASLGCGPPAVPWDGRTRGPDICGDIGVERSSPVANPAVVLQEEAGGVRGFSIPTAPARCRSIRPAWWCGS